MKIVSKLLVMALIFSGSALTMVKACGEDPGHSHIEDNSELIEEEENEE